GELSEDQFKPLRLPNGLYLQLHAYMLRINVPYGCLSSRQLRKLAFIARRYDRNFGHFTTRQNIQFNWIRLDEAPDILAELAEVEMNTMQSSGNCVRNITADQFAGRARDEIEDPRPWCELIRQWSILHPEFGYLPRKFKIAVTGAASDRAAVKFHDVGLYLRRNAEGVVGFEVIVGGGQGRTPFVGLTIREWLAKEDLFSYLEAILRIYNLGGRRDNPNKARIKIQVNALGIDEFRRLVDEEWAQIKSSPLLSVDPAEVARIATYFAPPAWEDLPEEAAALDKLRKAEPAFDAWYRANIVEHRTPGYAIVNLSLKSPGIAPGDLTADQMDKVADLADRYSLGELRVSHRQNLVFTDVRQKDLHELWNELEKLSLATPNIGTLTDIVACPGLDFCSLANARAIPVAQAINQHFGDAVGLRDIGELTINISGCMNACGHHHVGHIGILGVEKKGLEFYQLTLGGSSAEDAALGDRLGRAISAEEVPAAIEALVTRYKKLRSGDERFLDTYRRVGIEPFREAVYSDSPAARREVA
ncbi:MAG: nitrite/sulfite reductase, partial [Gammaproteobacteria bacterium]|nr:nitrite/sulfite reductase [Gammaproteobacteria bacterium]